jgi:dihydroorotate dehydrogenase
MYRLIKPILFSLNPEKAHELTFSLLRLPGVQTILSLAAKRDDPRLARQVAGLRFANPIGLAAGLDKDAIAFEQLGALGFGFVEIGTVTPRPQPGNDRPRLFRLPKDEALINRMGFNNHGAGAAAERLKRRKSQGLIIGGNIGKNKTTPNEDAANDYLSCMQTLHPQVDYLVVNVSSPNTPNLRELQEKEPLTQLLRTVQAENRRLGAKPLFLKIAPDMNNPQLDDVIEIVKETGLAGIIATNTTISREGLSYPKSEIDALGNGGLSGKPLEEKSTAVVRYLRKAAGNGLAIIGAGGIHSADDALRKLDAGADLIQLYTGFIYHGPGLIASTKNALLKRQP